MKLNKTMHNRGFDNLNDLAVHLKYYNKSSLLFHASYIECISSIELINMCLFFSIKDKLRGTYAKK